MSIFALLDFEGEVQLGDKTRLNSAKSFASKGVNEITSVTIKPDLSASAVEVATSLNRDEWFLDWVYTGSNIDLDSSNNKFYVNEETAGEITATLTAQTYASLSALLTELQTQLNAASSLTYTVTSDDNIITIEASGKFKITSGELQKILNFSISSDFETEQASSYFEGGSRIVTVTVSNGTESDTKYFYPRVLTKEGDYLFCEDQDLVAHEPDILKWCIDGRSSFKDVYRRAQKMIVAWLDERGFRDINGNKYGKRDIKDIEEVKQWATYLSLRLIFQGISNVVNDVFFEKAKNYSLLEEQARSRVILRIDFNKDGIVEPKEGPSIHYTGIVRR